MNYEAYYAILSDHYHLQQQKATNFNPFSSETNLDSHAVRLQVCCGFGNGNVGICVGLGVVVGVGGNSKKKSADLATWEWMIEWQLRRFKIFNFNENSQMSIQEFFIEVKQRFICILSSVVITKMAIALSC